MLTKSFLHGLAASVALTAAIAPHFAAADDTAPKKKLEIRTTEKDPDRPIATPPKKTEIRSRSGGMIRIVGPDGRVHEKQFGNLGGPDYDQMQQKLKELEQAAGDPEAVQRITKELMQLATPPQTLVAHADLPKYGIGLSLAEEIPASLRAHLKLDEGVLVQSVAKDSPAEKAGVKEYDVILAINGQPISLAATLVDAVQKAGENGDKLSLAVISAGEHKTVELTPTAATEIAWAFAEGGAGASVVPHPPLGLGWNDLDVNVPRIDLRFPPGMMAGAGGGTGFDIRPLHADAALQARIEKLEAELKEISARLEKLAEK